MTIRILITVSRSYNEWSTMRTALEKVYAEYPDAVLVHGGARPGDCDAARMWKDLGGAVEPPWKPDWPTCATDCKPGHRKVNRVGQEYCPTAGMRRNVAMVESAPDLVLAFVDPKSKTQGASHCARIAKDAGIPVVRYEQQGD
jgi:hypothetical protein